MRDEIIAQYPEAYDSEIIINYEFYGYDGAREYEVCFMRFETDKEMDFRMKIEESARHRKLEAKKKAEDKERALFEKLKKKFDK